MYEKIFMAESCLASVSGNDNKTQQQQLLSVSLPCMLLLACGQLAIPHLKVPATQEAGTNVCPGKSNHGNF